MYKLLDFKGLTIIPWVVLPITYLSMGGRYCSMMTVDGGKEFFRDLRIARIATAIEAGV